MNASQKRNSNTAASIFDFSSAPAQKSLYPRQPLSPKQRLLARQTLFDEMDGSLWVDAREIAPEIGAQRIPSWDEMMLGKDPIPSYPHDWRIFEWSHTSALQKWRKPIPQWIQQSCALFPSHQIEMLHYVGKYPQLLELLDHAPVLVWRLMQAQLSENDIHQLLSQKQTHLAAQLGWPAQKETLSLLRKLRLRFVSPEVAESIDTCILDPERRHQLQQLPRISSMALTLAARFPNLIGTPLHQTLAQLPCRPMQCQAMIALLEDATTLAEYLHLNPTQTLGQFRYLTDIETQYRDWVFQQFAEKMPQKMSSSLTLSTQPLQIQTPEQLMQISQLTAHAWFAEVNLQTDKLIAWKIPSPEEKTETLIAAHYQNQTLIKARTENNQLPTAQQLSQLALLQRQ